jgi:hypothetical protein
MPSYSGSGKSLEDPIVISGVESHFAAIGAEYQYLRDTFGAQGVDWSLIRQSLLGHEGRQIDSMEIQLKSGEELTLYFDITKYFGKF